MKTRKMKDSGVKWIGAIPEGWEMLRTKCCLRNISEKNHNDAEVLSLYREIGVVPKKSRDDNHNVTGDDTSLYKYVRRGDLVINKMKAWQGSLAVSDYEGIVSPAYYVCKFSGIKIERRYVHYLMRDRRYAQEFERLSTGMRVGQWDLGIDDFMRVPLVYPPLPEQRAIAAYLDDRCAKIDAMIGETKALIEEYKKWKGAIILERTSGVGFVSQSLKTLVSYNDEVLPEDTDGGCEFDYVDIGSVKYGKGIVCREHMTFANSPSRARRLVRPNDVIVSTVRTYLRSIAVVPKFEKQLVVSTGFIVLRAKHINARYLQYAIMSEDFVSKVESNSVGISYPAINASQVVSFKIPVPPSSEQKQIADYLDAKCAAIDRVVAEKEALIADLERYKKSLIFECVTGKRVVA